MLTVNGKYAQREAQCCRKGQSLGVRPPEITKVLGTRKPKYVADLKPGRFWLWLDQEESESNRHLTQQNQTTRN